MKKREEFKDFWGKYEKKEEFKDFGGKYEKKKEFKDFWGKYEKGRDLQKILTFSRSLLIFSMIFLKSTSFSFCFWALKSSLLKSEGVEMCSWVRLSLQLTQLQAAWTPLSVREALCQPILFKSPVKKIS